MMKKKSYLYTIMLLSLIIFSSCASTPVSTTESPKSNRSFPKDGIYSYDFDRYVNCVEQTLMYQSYGMIGYQTIQKKSWGNAVYIQNGSFVEPETRIILEISEKGEVTSPDNPSISGTYKKDGNFFFQGYYEENAQILKISISGKLLYSDEETRASSVYNGKFVLTDEGTGRKQNVTINNGLYSWEYKDKVDEDFTTWPVLVDARGKINCGFEMTVRSGIKGISEMMTSSTNQSIGSVDTKGLLQVETLTQTAGSGQSVKSDTITFSGVRGSQNLNQIEKDQVDEEAKKYFSASSKKKQNQEKANPPEWYSDFIKNDQEFLYGSARKTHENPNVALQVAEITAVNQIQSTIAQDVKIIRESEKTMTQGQNSSKESAFFQLVDSFNQITIPYTVKNKLYDNKTHTAYVVVELPREEAEKIIENNLK
ncbi:MAG: hypothetical protein K6C97_11780 [Treponema sp.]|nr:hypothetical protein [Treponema sp.]